MSCTMSTWIVEQDGRKAAESAKFRQLETDDFKQLYDTIFLQTDGQEQR